MRKLRNELSMQPRGLGVKRSGYEMVQPSHCLLPAARKAAEFSEAVRIRRQKPPASQAYVVPASVSSPEPHRAGDSPRGCTDNARLDCELLSALKRPKEKHENSLIGESRLL